MGVVSPNFLELGNRALERALEMKIRDITAKYGVLNSAEEKRWVHSIRRVNGDDQIGMRFKVLSREGWKLYSEKLFERDW